jgi:hypothetical protein
LPSIVLIFWSIRSDNCLAVLLAKVSRSERVRLEVEFYAFLFVRVRYKPEQKPTQVDDTAKDWAKARRTNDKDSNRGSRILGVVGKKCD